MQQLFRNHNDFVALSFSIKGPYLVDMPNNDYISNILEIKDLFITNIDYTSKENHIYFTLKHKDCVCPHCKAITNKVHDYRTSIIKDSPIMGKSTFLHYRKRRYHCDSCDRHFTEPFSLLPKNCRLTTRLCFEAIHLLKSSLNVLTVASQLGISVSSIFRRLRDIKHQKPKTLPLVLSIDEFKGNELISERNLQDYLGRYQDLRDEWKRKRRESTDITDDVVFEIELIRQVEINIDYILMLVKKYHDTRCEDKEVLITINKAIDASPELRSKKQLIETFIAGINDVDDVMDEWHEFVVEQRDYDLNVIITEEKLKPKDTRKFIENAFRDGEIKTAGTDIDKIMPPISHFGGGGRAKKKQRVIEKLKTFFEKYFGIGGSSSFNEPEHKAVTYDLSD